MNPFRSSFLCGLLLCAPCVLAHPALEAVENFVRGELALRHSGKISVQVGPLDARLRLPECARYQAYLPNNLDAGRLAGNASVGLRCLAPTRWNIFVPVKIAIETDYLAAANAIPAGHVVREADLVLRVGNLGDLPANVLARPEQAIGKTLKTALAPGQPLRQELLAMPVVIRSGQSVLLVFRGAGFTATNEGRALNQASEGQVAQARTASGTVVSGIAQADGTILVNASP
ncbi:MAG: flagellar basal body P-ring formation protein FlgA [Zoogloeaceae bacterium]|jgi:flagella basal body P-ring formation protein FlgA|nr:flagellar basal body P-ring formation protein FlgA [Zoogloeaceae bacterium]